MADPLERRRRSSPRQFAQCADVRAARILLAASAAALGARRGIDQLLRYGRAEADAGTVVDFDRINSGEIRFSVGAVNVRTGNFAYFDNAHITIRPEHVMASGALPPGFPAVEIDGEFYWDGGLVSNTPLQYVIEYIPRRSRLTFQVDLFHASGQRPTNLEEVNEREKDIRYSSRTRAATDTLRLMHDVRHNINNLWDQLPENLRATPEAKFLYNFGCVTTMDIVQLIYRPADT
jgi:NTE family protein